MVIEFTSKGKAKSLNDFEMKCKVGNRNIDLYDLSEDDKKFQYNIAAFDNVMLKSICLLDCEKDYSTVMKMGFTELNDYLEIVGWNNRIRDMVITLDRISDVMNQAVKENKRCSIAINLTSFTLMQAVAIMSGTLGYDEEHCLEDMHFQFYTNNVNHENLVKMAVAVSKDCQDIVYMYNGNQETLDGLQLAIYVDLHPASYMESSVNFTFGNNESHNDCVDDNEDMTCEECQYRGWCYYSDYANEEDKIMVRKDIEKDYQDVNEELDDLMSLMGIEEDEELEFDDEDEELEDCDKEDIDFDCLFEKRKSEDEKLNDILHNVKEIVTTIAEMKAN